MDLRACSSTQWETKVAADVERRSVDEAWAEGARLRPPRVWPSCTSMVFFYCLREPEGRWAPPGVQVWKRERGGAEPRPPPGRDRGLVSYLYRRKQRVRRSKYHPRQDARDAAKPWRERRRAFRIALESPWAPGRSREGPPKSTGGMATATSDAESAAVEAMTMFGAAGDGSDDDQDEAAALVSMAAGDNTSGVVRTPACARCGGAACVALPNEPAAGLPEARDAPISPRRHEGHIAEGRNSPPPSLPQRGGAAWLLPGGSG